MTDEPDAASIPDRTGTTDPRQPRGERRGSSDRDTDSGTAQSSRSETDGSGSRGPAGLSRRSVLTATSTIGAALAGGFAVAEGTLRDAELAAGSFETGTVDLEVAVHRGGILPTDPDWQDGGSHTVEVTPSSPSGTLTIGLRSCDNPARPWLRVTRAEGSNGAVEKALEVTLTYHSNCEERGPGDRTLLFEGPLSELLGIDRFAAGTTPGAGGNTGSGTGECFCLGTLEYDDAAGGPGTFSVADGTGQTRAELAGQNDRLEFDLTGDGLADVAVTELQTKDEEGGKTEVTGLSATLLGERCLCDVSWKYGNLGGATPVCGGGNSASRYETFPTGSCVRTITIEPESETSGAPKALSNVQFGVRDEPSTPSTPTDVPPVDCPDPPSCLRLNWEFDRSNADGPVAGRSAGFGLDLQAVQARHGVGGENPWQ